MKIAVLSDSHDNISAMKEAIRAIKDENIDTIIHLGDVVSPFTLKLLANFKVFGVFGNNDGEKQLLSKVAYQNGMQIEEQPYILNIEDKSFLLYHGSGSVEKTRRIVESFAKSGDYDFVLYGHTHMVDNRRIGNALLLNPGELCGYLTGKSSFAIVDLERDYVNIIEL